MRKHKCNDTMKFKFSTEKMCFVHRLSVYRKCRNFHNLTTSEKILNNKTLYYHLMNIKHNVWIFASNISIEFYYFTLGILKLEFLLLHTLSFFMLHKHLMNLQHILDCCIRYTNQKELLDLWNKYYYWLYRNETSNSDDP